MKTVGIIGGMGPESTAEFYVEVIKECQIQQNAKNDEDYPEIFIYNLPIPQIVDDVKDYEKTINMLIKATNKFELLNVDFMVMPCNTIHYFYDDLISKVKSPFLSLIESSVNKVKELKMKKVGLLATPTTIKQKIYKKVFDNDNLELIEPDEEEINILVEVIDNILAGKKLEEDKNKLLKIINKMVSQGAEAIILGCTDLPLLLTQQDTDIKLIDTIKVLAEATVQYAYQE